MNTTDYRKYVYTTLAGLAAVALVGYGMWTNDVKLIGWGLTVLAPGVVNVGSRA